MPLYLVISITTSFVVFCLSLFVLFNNPNNKSGRFFSLLGFSIVAWMINNMLADLSHDYHLALFLSRLAIIWVAFLPIFFCKFITELYYRDDFNFLQQQRIVILISYLATLAIIIFNQTSLSITTLTLHAEGSEYQPGALYYLLFFYYLIAFGFSFFYLFKAYRSSKNYQRSQIWLILFGSSLTVCLGIITNIFLPLLGYSEINIFGPPSVLFFIGLTTIAILKHHLFNIKIIALELVIFGLWVFMLIRILYLENNHSVLLEAALLGTSIIFGVLLIRSTLHGIKQSEQIEQLTLKMEQERANMEEVRDLLEQKLSARDSP